MVKMTKDLLENHKIVRKLEIGLLLIDNNKIMTKNRFRGVGKNYLGKVDNDWKDVRNAILGFQQFAKSSTTLHS